MSSLLPPAAAFIEMTTVCSQLIVIKNTEVAHSLTQK